MRIQFLIRALSLGGAERQLVLLAEELCRRGHQVEVITFYPGLPIFEKRLERKGVRVAQLRKRGRADVLGFVGSLTGAVRAFTPDVIYSFLPTANVIASLVLRRISSAAIVWGVRSSSVELPGYDWLGRTLARAERWLRKSPDAVICNSQAGYDLCRKLDFPSARLSIARNMLDLDANRFDPEGRSSIRRELGIADSTLLIGGAGRIDPVKGFEVLIKAVATYGDGSGPVALAIAGDGPLEYRQSLVAIASAAGMGDRVKWMGRVEDMKRFYSAVDVFCSSSIGAEATSNVVAEALACERLTVATEVGDSPELIDDRSLLANPRDVISLAEAIARAALRLPTWDGAKARARIGSQLSPEVSIAETERALARALAVRRTVRADPQELES